MKVEFDPVKRQLTLGERGLDFLDAPEIFDGRERTTPDLRFDYPEERWFTLGLLRDRLVAIVWTPAEQGIRVISMRKANDREQRRYRTRMG